MAQEFEIFGVKFEFESAESRAEIIKLLGDYKALKKELESAVDVESIQIVAKNLDNTAEKLKKLGVEVGNTKSKIDNFSKSSSEAQYALVNLSRIAQDAPYGFIGIANNLNPALESFQRLGEKSKESGGALKALGTALMGPAGVGLALGIVSSLIVKYGDVMMEAINKTTELEKAQKSVRDAFIDNVKGVEETIVKDEALVSVINNTNLSLDARRHALQQLKDAHKGNVELQKTDIDDGEKLIEIINRMSEALLRKAQIEAFAKIIAEKQAELIRLQTADINEQVDKLSGWTKAWNLIKGTFASAGGFGAETRTGLNNINSALDETAKKSATTKVTIDKLKDSFKELVKQSFEAGDYDVIGKEEKTKKTKKFVQKIIKPAYDEDAELALQMATENARQNRALGIDKLGETKTTGTKGLFGDDTDFNKATSSTTFKRGMKEVDDFFKKNKERFKEANEEAKRFANTIANIAVGAFDSLWNAIEQGKDPMEALGNMFLDLAKKIAEAAIKAAVFTAIMSLLPGGTAITGAADITKEGGGFLDMFKGLLGFADGGLVSRPTLAMVGEGGESEAIMPLSKLGNLVNNSFNAGTNYGGGGSQNGQFVLRGNDLVLAMQRSNYSLNLRRGS